MEAYGHAKLAAEWACLDAAQDGLDVSIVRPRTILGHGRLGIFGILFEWIADGRDPIVLGDGTNRYQFVHSDDLADVCVLAAERNGPGVFNVGTDRFGTMRETLEALCAHAGTDATVRSLPAGPASLGMQLTAGLGITPFAPYHWMMYSKSMWFDIEHLHDAARLDTDLVDRRDVRPELRLVRRQPGDHRRCTRLAPPSEFEAGRAEARETRVRTVATGTVTVALIERLRRHQTAISVAILALLAYVPALTAPPGRMPTDSKLYVYLNPGRFLADATTTFDPRQFAGWVPHQHIAYLWPTGPVVLVLRDARMCRTGSRTVSGSARCCSLAGLGVRWMARVLGFAPLAALAAALVYQLSPYILPYISRTSVLLLPYAGLGWIVGLTVMARLRGRWRYPAAIALVVLTVGAVNATALAMVVPAPVLWLIHAAWGGTITWRRAAATAAKTGVLCLGVSLWWIVMLVIQGRYGADVLAYSESLEAVSFTSTSTEVTRGLGYWLFYVRDAYAPTTTASIDHLASGRTILWATSSWPPASPAS